MFLPLKSASSSLFIQSPTICLTNASWSASKFSNSTNDGWIGQRCTEAIKLLYLCLNPWMIILLILDLEIFDAGSNLEISRQRDFTFVKYWVIVIFHCAIGISSFSSNCSLTLFFFENNVAKVSHVAFGVFARLMCSKISSSILVLIANIAFLALTFHFHKAWSLIKKCGFSANHNLPQILPLQVWLHAGWPRVVILVVKILTLPTTWRSSIATWWKLSPHQVSLVLNHELQSPRLCTSKKSSSKNIVIDTTKTVLDHLALIRNCWV